MYPQIPWDLLTTLYRTLLWIFISRFRREVDQNCAPQGYYAASSGNSLPTFLEDGTNSLS